MLEDNQKSVKTTDERKVVLITVKVTQATVERLEGLAKGYTKQARASMGSRAPMFTPAEVVELLIKGAPEDFISLVSEKTK